jgi:anti-sigma-K factor RskA
MRLDGGGIVNLFQGDLPDRLAAEYVLGTLRGAARRRFDALMPAHPVLQRAVSQWERTMLPMALKAPPVTPSAGTWPKLEARLGWAAGTGRTEAPASALPLVSRALRFWQSIAAVATVAAVVLGTQVRTGPVEAPMVVVLKATATTGEATTLVAGVSPDRQQLSIRPLERVSLANDRSLELWVIPKGKAPLSLGVIKPDGLTAVSRGALPKDSEKLAVTLEPLGGSPSGKPTGPVVFVGDLTI